MRRISSAQAKAHAISSGVAAMVHERDGGCCVYCGRPGRSEAHYIPRSKGGLGVPENILTLCRKHHDAYDLGTRQEREGLKEFFREYLQSQYPDWDESKLIYHKYGGKNA